MQQYQQLSDDVLSHRHTFTIETLEITERLLHINGDHYTCWNLRKDTLLHLFENMSAEERVQACVNELKLTLECVRKSPKSYWVWLHRVWTLRVMPATKQVWQKELGLVSMMLDLDHRNCRSSFIAILNMFSSWMGLQEDVHRCVIENVRIRWPPI